jgi:ribosomal protein S18 acetylase RimI-like enzyme
MNWDVHPISRLHLGVLSGVPPTESGEVQQPAAKRDKEEIMSDDALTIRPYVERDEAGVVRLWQTVFPDNPPWNAPAEDIRRKLAVQRDLFLVGEYQGEVVATVLAGYDGHRGWMHLVAVDPRFRRRGFGQAMMSEAERRLAQLGCPKVNLQVRATNEAVVAFYRKLGYAVEERVSMGKRLAL